MQNKKKLINQLFEGNLLTDWGYTVVFFIGCVIGAILSYA